jgi:signal transduction histidine kinase/ligand-binding sensor domain-containing protein/DNA-binding response OmpR family regulator
MFLNFTHDSNDGDSIPHNQVNVVKVDAENNVWLGTKSGLVVLRLERAKFESTVQSSHLNTGDIRDVLIVDKSVWVSIDNAGLTLLNTATLDISTWDDVNGVKSNNISTLSNGGQGNIWLGYDKHGISRFNSITNKFTHLSHSKDPNSLSGNNISSIKQLANKELWVAVSGVGISIYSPSTGKFENINSSKVGDYNLNDNIVKDFYQDTNNNIWLSTHHSGVLFLSHLFFNTSDYRLHNYDWRGISSNTVWATTVDSGGRIWIGTNEKLHIIDEINQTNSTPFDVPITYDVVERKNGDIWLATGGGLYEIDKNLSFKRSFFTEPDHPLYSKTMLKLFEDSNGILWIGSSNEGVLKFDDSTSTFKRFSPSDNDDLASVTITSFVEDKQGKLWLGTSSGIYFFDEKAEQFLQHDSDIRDLWSLIYRASNNELWAGTTGNGIYVIDLDNDGLQQLTEKNGLAGNTVICLVESGESVWAATQKGLSEIQGKNSFDNYYNYHGLQDGYNFNSCATESDGKFYFGGGTGVSFFYSDKLSFDKTEPVVNITAFSVYNAEKNQYVKANKSQNMESLQYFQNNVNIDFTGIYYTWPNALNFEYRLLGLSERWVPVSKGQYNVKSLLGPPLSMRYTNLSANDYEFQVRAKSPDGVWSDIAKHSFSIRSPWWETPIAYVFYLLLLIVFITFLIRLRTRTLLRQRTILEKKVAIRTKELQLQTELSEKLSKTKNQLFGNVSHEFRTPLTIILANAEDIQLRSSVNNSKSASAITKSATRLLQMVEKLLDFSSLNPFSQIIQHKYEMKSMIDGVFSVFDSLLKKQNMNVKIFCEEGFWVTFEDDGLEKVLGNLLSNAIKFSPPNSNIVCEVEVKKDRLFISIQDSGPGISHAEKKRVFERFYRGQSSEVKETIGTGIGLALVSELVERNKGTITIDNDFHPGCKFIVTLPYSTHHDKEYECKESSFHVNQTEQRYIAHDLQSIPKTSFVEKNHENDFDDMREKDLLLIIEDNLDLGQLIADSLQDKYRCIQAYDGKEGLATAKKCVPDIIISDVMMGELDGFDVLKSVKSDVITSHIPVVLLTALGDQFNKMKGWEGLADDYITKPFNRTELQARVLNILTNRKILKQYFGKSIGEIELNNLELLPEKDQKFISSFKDIIEKEYDSSELTRLSVSGMLFMSERQLNRKLSALFDHNFTEYVRSYRLKKSLEFINNGLQITQISQKVGFTSLPYFSSCFKEEFGVSIKKYEQLVQNGDVIKGKKINP